MLPFSNLFQWNVASDFIADHLNYDLLEPAHELVDSLFRKSSFEFLLFLCRRKHSGHQPKFLLINTEIVSIMLIFSVRFLSVLVTTPMSSVVMQHEKSPIWTQHVYRILMSKNVKKYERTVV